jgi:hypothetical protein
VQDVTEVVFSCVMLPLTRVWIADAPWSLFGQALAR